jgi:hypothetical protein
VRSPQAQTTAEQYERTGKRARFFSCFFSLLSLRSFRVCSLHAQEGPLTALVLFLSHFLSPRALKKREKEK